MLGMRGACGIPSGRAGERAGGQLAARAPGQINRGLRTQWTRQPLGETNCDLQHPPTRPDTTMKILPVIVLLACVAWQVSARAQDEGEARAAPTRGLLKRGLPKKPTTTTTTPAPQEDAEYEEEGDYGAEGEAQEPSTEAAPSSTEGKKLVGGGVRPFRSNTDLLETLKRRRAQAAEAKLHGHAPAASTTSSQSQDAPVEAPTKANLNNKKRFNNAPARDSNSEDAPAPSKPGRGRFGRPASRSIPEPETEEQNDAAPPTRTGRGFSRRGSN